MTTQIWHMLASGQAWLLTLCAELRICLLSDTHRSALRNAPSYFILLIVFLITKKISFSMSGIDEQQTTHNWQTRALFLQQLQNAKLVSNESGLMRITMNSFGFNRIPYQFHFNESSSPFNFTNSFNEPYTLICEETLANDDVYLGQLYDSDGLRATLLTWECSDADCCRFACCARSAIKLHMAIIIILALSVFVLLRFLAKFCCRRIQIVWRRRKKAKKKEKIERLKYFGTSHVRSQQEYFNSISSLHQIPNVAAAMPIAVQGGDSELPKPPPFHERLFPLLALRSSRPDSQTSLASCHTYESSGGSANQQMTSERPRSASQLRLTLNSVSPSPDDNLCH